MPPLPMDKGFVQQYVAENGYFHIYELIKTAEKEPAPAAMAAKKVSAEVKHYFSKKNYNNQQHSNILATSSKQN